jgi:hypothetical protein
LGENSVSSCSIPISKAECVANAPHLAHGVSVHATVSTKQIVLSAHGVIAETIAQGNGL